jgi:protein-L-isoaspartate(D-aspartate) O-methyltransferase
MTRRFLVGMAGSLIVVAGCGWMLRAWANGQEPKPGQDEKAKDAAAKAEDPSKAGQDDKAKDATAKSEDRTQQARNRMVQRHLVARGIKNNRVLDAFRTVPRHLFIPLPSRPLAYDDESIPIGEGQTITPPYDVAFMTEVLDPKPTDRVYEVGTGSGYQSAILSRLVKEVYSVEIHAPLSKAATQVHKEVGYTNIHTRVGDGYEGWPDAAPFDSIIVTCAPQKVPQPLVDQLRDGGRLVIPLGTQFDQTVFVGEKHDGKVELRRLKPTLFVPMTGRALREAAAARTEGKPKTEKADEKP